VRFTLTDDQVAYRDAVRSLLARTCPPAAVRQPDDRVWAGLAGMGLFGALVPAELGGLGLTEVDLVPVLTELGYAAVPHPVAETMMVAAPLLASVGDPRLPDVIAGRLRIAVAGPTGLVPYGARCDAILILHNGPPTLVPPDPSLPEPSVDPSRALTRLRPHPSPRSRKIPPDWRSNTVESSLIAGELAGAAMGVGVGRRMLELTTGYVSTRRQFGAAVGSFQAVKHHLADALLRLEFAAPAVLAAGWHLARRTDEARRLVSLAAVLANEAATGMARTAIQCHGAIGYTVEYDLHLYAKRAWALAAACDTDAHLERIATSLRLLEGAPA
jgi:alkylation response protein AidB-like acyl-CoA dehydrogenase